MIYTGLNRTGEIETIKTHGGGEIAEVYGGINYQNPIFYSRKTLTGASPLTFKGLGQPLKDYHIFGETIQDGTPSPDYPVDVQGVGEYDYVSGKYYVPISGDTTEICDIHDIDRGTLWCGITSNNYYVNPSYLVNVSTQTSTPNVILIPVKSATTYQVKFKTNNTVLRMNGYVRVAFINEFAEGALAYDVYTWQKGGNGDKLRNDKEYYVTMTNTNHRYLVVQSNLSPFGLFDYFSIQEVLSVIDIGSDPLYRVGDYADEIDFANQQIIRRIKKVIINGTESMSAVGPYGGGKYKLRYRGITKSGICSGQEKDTHFKTTTKNMDGLLDGEMSFIGISSSYVDFCKDTTIRSLQDWRDYFAEQYSAGTPVTLLYVLTTPEVTSITIPTLTTITGDNTMSIDTTVKPSAVSITGHIKPTGYGQLVDVNGVKILDKDNVPIYVHGQQ